MRLHWICRWLLAFPFLSLSLPPFLPAFLLACLTRFVFLFCFSEYLLLLYESYCFCMIILYSSTLLKVVIKSKIYLLKFLIVVLLFCFSPQSKVISSCDEGEFDFISIWIPSISFSYHTIFALISKTWRERANILIFNSHI